ncbi:MAG: type II toxin-antitoxin system Phd/YefM family antitoxin [Acidobacteriota bacterium]
MEKTISAVSARENFGTLIDEAYYRGDAIIIERAGKAMAAVVSIDQYHQWQMRREEFFAMVDQVQRRTKRMDGAELEGAIREAVSAARAERRPGPGR